MKLTKLLIFLVVFFTSTLVSNAQDIQFSQFYAAALYQNPAFAGSMHASRGILQQRIQWPSLQAKYMTSLASFDTYFSKVNSGLGLMVIQDFQGSNNISSTEAHAQYSYELKVSPKFTTRAGLDLGYMSRSVDYSQFLYPHDYNDDGRVLGVSGLEGLQRKSFLDVGAGVLGYTDQLWAGVTFSHINQPNQSLYGNVSRLPIKGDFTAGYKFYLQRRISHDYDGEYKGEFTLTPTAHYKFQGKSDQLDIGVYAFYDNVLFGVWYRGLPVKNYPGFVNNEAMIANIGYRISPFTIQYSYDFTVSSLQRARTGGSHELSLTYVHKKSVKKHKMSRRLPCPDFYHHLQGD